MTSRIRTHRSELQRDSRWPKLAIPIGLLAGIVLILAVGSGSVAAAEWNETVGVVDDDGEFGEGVQSMLEDELPTYYDVSMVSSTHPRDSLPHDVYVVESLDPDTRSSFINYTNSSSIGVVYLERGDDGSNGIRQLADETGEPDSVDSTTYDTTVNYVVNNSHPILDLPAGQSVPIQEGPLPYPEIPWFESNSTDLIASISTNGIVFGEALAVDENRSLVLASGLGLSEWLTPANFTQEGKEILRNTVMYTNQNPGFSIGVVDDAGQHGDAVAGAIENDSGLPPVVDVETVHGTHPSQHDPHDVYVVQQLSTTNRSTFIAGSTNHDTGVVYLDQRGSESNGIEQIAGSFLVNASGEGTSNETPIGYTVAQDHPILDDWTAGEHAPLLNGTGDHSWFTNASGEVIATVGSDTTSSGSGLAVDDELNQVYAGSLGRTSNVTNANFTPAANAILGNAISHTATHPPDMDINITGTPSLNVVLGDTITIESTITNNENRSYEFAVPIRANGTFQSKQIVTVPGESTVNVTHQMVVGITQPENMTVEVALPHTVDSETVTVTKSNDPQDIWYLDLNLTNDTVPLGATPGVTATAGNIIGGGPLDVTNDSPVWSSNTTVATVDNGSIETHTVGETTIFVEILDEIVRSAELTVREPRIAVMHTLGHGALYVNNSEQLGVYAAFDNGTTWGHTSEGFTATSNNTSVVQIENGSIVAVGPGETNVTATATHNESITLTEQVDVRYPEVTNLEVALDNDAGFVDDSTDVTVTATWRDGDTADVTDNASISSYDESVAKPVGDTIQLRNSGSTTIYAKFSGKYETRNDVEAAWNTTDITVIEESLESIDLSLNPSTLAVGESGAATVTATHAAGLTEDITPNATIDSTNTTVATVTDGTVQAHAAGSTSLTATYQNETTTTSLTVEPPATIQGTVTNSSGDPITGTSVILTPGNHTATTDSGGSFTVSNVSAGTYTVSTSHPDYETNTTTVTVSQGESVSVPVSLTWTGTAPPTYEMTVPNDGEAHSIGFPSDASGTLADAFPDGYDGLNDVYRYDNGWTRVTDFENVSIDPLDAYVLKTAGAGPSNISLAVSLETGTSPTTQSVGPGWTYIAASSFTDAESSFGGSVDGSVTVLDRYGGPTSSAFQPVAPFAAYQIGSYEWGVSPPTVSPFKGYFVYFDQSADLPVVISNLESKEDASFQLGIDD